MRRVPLSVVIPLCLVVPSLTWWVGTRDYDFLAPPSRTELERIRAAVHSRIAGPEKPHHAVSPAASVGDPGEVPAPEPEVPVIDPGSLEGFPPLDAFSEHRGKPAASLVELASRLESEAHLVWALPAWERVIDHSSPDESQLTAALNGIRRLRHNVPSAEIGPAEPVPLVIEVQAPADRIRLARRAADEAAETVSKASGGFVVAEADLARSDADSETPRLAVSLTLSGQALPGTTTPAAPETVDSLRDAMLAGVFKLISARLTLATDLSPVPAPARVESPADSLNHRITRLAWKEFADSAIKPAGE